MWKTPKNLIDTKVREFPKYIQLQKEGAIMIVRDDSETEITFNEYSFNPEFSNYET